MGSGMGYYPEGHERMREAKITCLCSEISFKDLRLSLKKGEVVWISESSALGSIDLKRFASLGAVKVEHIERYRSRVKTGASLPRKVIPPPPQKKKAENLAPRIKFLEDSVYQLKEILVDMRGNIITGMQRQEKLLSNLGNSTTFFQGVTGNPRSLPQKGKEIKPGEDSEEKEEIFIPSRILLGAELENSPKAETSQVGGLEESAKLLKSLKRKKSSKGA